jgi:hypothetical protein
MLEAQLVNLLRGNDALPAGDGASQGVQHRRLSGLRSTGHDDIQAGHHTGLEKSRRARRDSSKCHQIIEARSPNDKLSYIHRYEPACDSIQYDVQAVPQRQRRIDEGARQVEATT